MEVAMQNLVESIRPIVDVDGWDYCVVWKLGEDQRFLEWMGCCCGGSRSCVENAAEELVFPLAPSCRDAMILHLRTEACELLAQLPSSKPLDSGMYTQTLMSNQPAWLNLNFSSNSHLEGSNEVGPGTRVLVPVPIGIIELFTTKNVQENQQVVDFIVAQFQSSLEQHIMMNSSNADLTDFGATIESLSLPHDITAERIKLTDSPANYFQQFNYSVEAGNASGGFIEGSSDSFLAPVKSGLEAGQVDLDGLQRAKGDKEYLHRQGTGRSESNSDCSDQNEEEDDTIPMKRGGKGQAKNLVAERKRRKKLNERLYALRALVPRISKLDRASILGDAIEFVKELKDQVEDLQHELEDGHSDEDTNKSTIIINNNNNNNVANFKVRGRPEKPSGGVQTGETSIGAESSDTNNNNDKLRQMEPQVEVVQLYGNEFYVKIFCEHKMGGFVRLMEALDSLGLEVTNVNITNFRSLVSNVFKVERRDNETIHADYVRESLLEITRNPCGSGWQEMMMMTTHPKTHENEGDDTNCRGHRYEQYNNNNQSQYHGNSRLQHCHPFHNIQNN